MAKREVIEKPMRVKSYLYENSGAPKNVAADCAVANSERATAYIGIAFDATKNSFEVAIFLFESTNEAIKRITIYEANTSQS